MKVFYRLQFFSIDIQYHHFGEQSFEIIRQAVEGDFFAISIVLKIQSLNFFREKL